MKYLLCLMLIFTVTLCFSQKHQANKQKTARSAIGLPQIKKALTIATNFKIRSADTSIIIIKSGLNLALNGHDTTDAATLLAGLSEAYAEKGKTDTAIAYTERARHLLGATKNDYLADAYILLSDSVLYHGYYDKAVTMLKLAIESASQTGPRNMLRSALNELARITEFHHDYRQALNYYRQAFDISDSLEFVRKTKENTSEAYSRNFVGDVMGNIKQENNSVDDILKNIETKRSLNDTLALSISYFNLGVLYKSKRMYPQALQALQNSLKYARAIHYIEMESSAMNELADLYEQLGNYEQSLDYLKRHMALSALDSKGPSIDQLQAKYEITQREDQLLQQQFAITIRNYWMAGISIVVVLMIVIGFIYYKQTQLKQRNIAMQAIIATEESERKRIAQDLHDSVSQTMSAAKMNLSVIGAEIPFANDEQRKRYEKVIGMVDDGFREVRTISHNMMPWALHQTGLALVVKQFIENFENDAISINFFSRGFDEPFDDTTEIILYRVLQESVNNVIKHANASRIDISLIRDEDNISLTIEDNGKGFDATNPGFKRGMGLNNLLSRINFLKGKFELDSHPGRGTLVSIYIPLAKK